MQILISVYPVDGTWTDGARLKTFIHIDGSSTSKTVRNPFHGRSILWADTTSSQDKGILLIAGSNKGTVSSLAGSNDIELVLRFETTNLASRR